MIEKGGKECHSFIPSCDLLLMLNARALVSLAPHDPKELPPS